MSGYKFDVFISYCRHGNVQSWLLNHFYRKLKDCLADHLPTTPSLYIDRNMSRGVHWPSDLRKALQHSKIMVPVLNVPYFESRWCLAEWRSMAEREKLLGFTGLERPQGLMYPVLYADSRNFPEEARERSWFDFKPYSNPDPGFQDSRDYTKFHQQVVTLAEDLAELLDQVPAWQPDWPLAELSGPYHIPPPPMPRFDA